jgi:hypothetical protein
MAHSWEKFQNSVRVPFKLKSICIRSVIYEMKHTNARLLYAESAKNIYTRKIYKSSSLETKI